MVDISDIIADLHVHTIASLHACSTLKECIDSAVDNGMKFLAITDHYYDDGTELYKKNEITRISRLESRARHTKVKIQVFGGVEFNIGQEISAWKKLSKVTWKLMGVHGWFLDRENTSLDELYQHFANAVGKCNAFAHIERELHKMEHSVYGDKLTDEVKAFLRKIVELAKQNDIYLEVNESSLIDNEAGTYERLRYWLQYAKENGNYISLGTDAHYCEEIGDFTNTIKLLNEIDFPKEKILNCNINLLQKLNK